MAHNVIQGLHFKRILFIRSDPLQQDVFQAPKFGLDFGQFPLVPPLQNFKKRAIYVALPNWSELDVAGTFGAAVLRKMLSKVCT